MKKVILIVLTIVIGLCTVGCSAPIERESERVNVIATAYSSDAVYDTELKVITKTITATVYPETARNKKVDFSLAWAENSEQAQEDLSEYLVLSQLEDGGTTANVICKKPFKSTVILTCTSRANEDVKAVCEVTYLGFATSFNVFLNASLSENSDVYVLERGKDYEFSYSAVDFFNESCSADVSYILSAFGNAYLLCSSSSGSSVEDYDLSVPFGGASSFPQSFFVFEKTDSGFAFTPDKTFCDLNEVVGVSSMFHSSYSFIGPNFSAGDLDLDDTYYNANMQKLYNNEVYFVFTMIDNRTGLSDSIKFNVLDSVASVEMDFNITF